MYPIIYFYVGKKRFTNLKVALAEHAHTAEPIHTWLHIRDEEGMSVACRELTSWQPMQTLLEQVNERLEREVQPA